MFRVFSSCFLLLGCSIHLFCCGVPLLIGIFSLTSSIAGSSLFLINEIWSEAYETPLLIFTTMILLMFIVFEINNKRLNYKENACCPEDDCDKKKNLTKINLKISILFYSINTFLFIIEKY
ncbi:MAG: hypothetical protein CBC25_01855 [Pelagibacteraceae bacterium TMED65]|nr:hypothetical protein [Rickettsiales bacterium]OUU52860.1 MAG: hypothetical protein CBC25_01855 [Pelagibacteraceae bacterium TMED65]